MSARFDSVVMLTWSDWRTEPRSNRYHYATRFARHVPVFFVQPDAQQPLVEATEVHGISLVHVSADYGAVQLAGVARLLAERGLKRPLLWAYNPFYVDVERHFPGALRVFHATEDYFTGFKFHSETTPAARRAQRIASIGLQRRMIRTVRDSDLVVCVSPGVAEGVARHCGYRGPIRVLENGCDFAFWSAYRREGRASRGDRVAIYQGGINDRLDAALLVQTMRRLPDWEFRFCGTVSGLREGWRAMQAEANFRYLGMLKAEEVREALYQADVGLMPYRQIEGLGDRLLPLKAFEYAACGLPVVSTPIDSIAHLPDVFRFARSTDEFVAAIREEAATLDDPARRAKRLAAARAQDYDRRFAELQQHLDALVPARCSPSVAVASRLLTLSVAESWNRTVHRIASKAQS